MRQLRQPLLRKLPAAALDVLLEAPRAPEHGGGGAGVLQRLVVGVLVLLVRVVVALDRDLELLKVPQLLDDQVLDGLDVGQRVHASQRQLHGTTLRWRGEALGTLVPLRCETLLLPSLLPVAVVGLVARVTTAGCGHAARQPAIRPELATEARVATRDRDVVHFAEPSRSAGGRRNAANGSTSTTSEAQTDTYVRTCACRSVKLGDNQTNQVARLRKSPKRGCYRYAPLMGLLYVLTIDDALQLQAPVRPQRASGRLRPLQARSSASWVNEIAVHGIEAVLQSDDADEYVAMLQQSASWQSVSKVVALCYEAGATHVLVYGSSVGDPQDWRKPGSISLAVNWCPERWNRDTICTCDFIRLEEEFKDRLTALVGNPVHIVDLELDHLAMAEHNEKFWSGCSMLPGGGEEAQVLPESLWVSRCGAVRPARSFVNLIFEMAACEGLPEEASATR